MKYALYTGCVAKGAGRELLTAIQISAKKLGIELVEMDDVTCCGAGVVHEDNPMLADAINARTFSLAEEMGMDILTICATCQGVMRRVQQKLEDNPDRLEQVNAELQNDTGRTYKGTVKVKHFYEVIADDYGFDKLADKCGNRLEGLKIAPYYGCYSLRPHDVADIEVADKPENMEKAITATGAEFVHFPEMQKCCGFPILMPNKTNSLHLAGNVINGAKKEDAHCIVTICPLCHLNLDSYQSEIESMFAMDLGLPVLHYPQMIALALGATPEELNLDSHITEVGNILAPCK